MWINKNSYFYIHLAVVVLVTFMTGIRSERILLLAHLQGSHLMQIASTGQELLNRGHDVYYILPKNSRFTAMVQNKGFKILTIDVTSTEGLFEADDVNAEIDRQSFDESYSLSEMVRFVQAVGDKHCDLMLHDSKLVNIIKKLNFHLALVDSFTVSSCLPLLPYYLGIPFVGQSSATFMWDVGVPSMPSFMTCELEEATDRMTFTQKVKSLAVMLFFNSPFSFIERNYTLLIEFAPQLSSWQHLRKQAKLFIVPRDHILEYPTPTMPHVIKTAGMNYVPAKPLPSDLLRQLKSTNNTIVVSFGSSAGAMPKIYVETLFEAFSQFPDYTFVWKLPTADVYTLPQNVIALSWLPQNDLLGHNKTKLFITHCGSNGLHEALYHAVPIVGFPLFADQFHNAFNVEQRGYGVRLNIKMVTSNELVHTIKFVLNNETIRNKVSKVSSIMKERVPPTQEAAFWIEHVLKYGDEHLRPASIDMSLYELYMLDVFTVLFLLLLAMTFILYLIVNSMHKMFCSSGIDKKEKSD